jgi:hypothetical protein
MEKALHFTKNVSGGIGKMKFPVITAAAAGFALMLAPLGAAASTTKTPAKKAAKTNVTSRWRAENVSGSIDMVDPSHKLLIVKGDSTIFDFVVTRRTKIMDGSKRTSLAQLSSKDNGQVKVHFVPERKGDVAASIEVSQ